MNRRLDGGSNDAAELPHRTQGDGGAGLYGAGAGRLDLNVTPELDSKFRAAALREGLVDVRYDVVDSPVGELFLAATPRGLCRISYTVDGQDEVVARIFGTRVLRSPLDEVRRELDQYFEGNRREFDLPLDLRVAPFHEDVLRELARVPYGQTDTYGHLAALVGRPKAARAVGTVMNRNPIPIVLPCHRIVGATGALTGYAGGLDTKRRLLALEGVTGL
jgi:methylated-DNA-[protein]-cysteine S-methyltransferase